MSGLPSWLNWALLPVLLFVAFGGGAMAVAAIVAACMPSATWPQTRYAAVRAGLYGAGAVTAAIVLSRIWPP